MRQCETYSLPEARSIWRLGVSSAPEKPRWVLVGLQTDKSGNQERDAALFDHCNLMNMHVCLNHSRYPSVDMATYFTKEQYATFKPLYPIHVFVVSKQGERLTEGVVDLTVRMEFSANAQAYSLVIIDRMLKFKSDVSKLSVLF